MAKEKTISDYIEKQNQHLSFEERCKKFEEIIETASKEWGIAPWAQLVPTKEAIISVPVMKDLWESSNVSDESGT